MCKNPEWADKLLKEVDSKWEEWREQLPKNEKSEISVYPGWDAFDSPINNGELLIIGINPGGKNYNYTDERHSASLSCKNCNELVVEDYPLAEKIRYLFEQAEISHLLAKSVKTNRYYFRSVDERALKKIDGDVKNELDEFSNEWTLTVIEKTKPRAILAISVGVFDWLRNLLSKNEYTLSEDKNPPITGNAYSKTYRLFTTCTVHHIPTGRDIRIAGIIHPTGKGPTKKVFGIYKQIIKNHLGSFLMEIIKKK